MQKCFSYVEYINNTTYKVAEWNIQLNFIYFCCRHRSISCVNNAFISNNYVKLNKWSY